jgi:hypothetical protein
MPDDLDLTEQDRVRRALMAYKMAHGIGTPRLSRRIKAAHPREAVVPVRTLSRFLAGERINPMALMICATFLAQLPDKPTLTQTLADTLKAFYATSPPDIQPGSYSVTEGQRLVSEVTLTPSDGFLVMKEMAQPHAIYDGLLVNTGTMIAILRDQLMLLPRLHFLSHDMKATTHYTNILDKAIKSVLTQWTPNV